MKKFLLPTSLLALFLILSIHPAKSQELDLSFHSPEIFTFAEVSETLKLSNGQIIATGRIEYADGNPVNGVVKINPDGTIDESFNFELDLPSSIQNLVENSLGEIIFASRSYLGKMDINGDIIHYDEEFKGINDFAIQTDDKIVLARSFRENDDEHITRINSDLTIDEDFSTSTSADNSVYTVDVKGDKIYVAGNFSTINGQTKNSIAKLNLDGSIDESFDAGQGTNDGIGMITVQEDGKVLIGDSYINSFDGFSTNPVVRLNADGSIDQTFDANFPAINGPSSELYIYNDNIYIFAFSRFSDDTEDNLFRLNMDGSRDTSFPPVVIDYDYQLGLNLIFLDDGFLFSGKVSNGPKEGITKLDYKGLLIEAFSTPISKSGSFSSIKKLGDKLYVTGSFYQIEDQSTFNIARLNLDGSLDPSFLIQENLGENGQVEMTPDNKILYNTGQNFLKLNLDASVDPTFDYVNFKDMFGVSKFHILENGKIMIFGPNNFYRLNDDGSEDLSYMNGEGTGDPNGGTTNFGFQKNGKMIVSGIFETYDGQAVSGIIRVNEDGTLDESFDTQDGVTNQFFNSPQQTKVFSNDSILITGFFDEYNGQPTNGHVQLGPDGELLTLNAFPDNTIFIAEFNHSMLLQYYDRDQRNYFWQRRYFDGSIDSTFVVPTELSGYRYVNQVYMDSINSKTAYMQGSFEIEGEVRRRQLIKISLNRAPTLISLNSDIEVFEDNAFTLTKESLSINDVDDPIENVSIIFLEGENYTLDNNTITPDENFYGDLPINLKLTDGIDTSEVFQPIIEAKPVNDQPIISGQTTVPEIDSEGLEIDINQLTIIDPDNEFPADFTLNIKSSDEYTVSDGIIKATIESDTLNIIVTVEDGELESDEFLFKAKNTTVTANTHENSIEVSLFPNPATKSLSIISDNFGIVNTLTIIDQRGSKIKEYKFSDKSHYLNVDDLSSGIYIIKIQTDQNKWFETKFMKQD